MSQSSLTETPSLFTLLFKHSLWAYTHQTHKTCNSLSPPEPLHSGIEKKNSLKERKKHNPVCFLSLSLCECMWRQTVKTLFISAGMSKATVWPAISTFLLTGCCLKPMRVLLVVFRQGVQKNQIWTFSTWNCALSAFVPRHTHRYVTLLSLKQASSDCTAAGLPDKVSDMSHRMSFQELDHEATCSTQ